MRVLSRIGRDDIAMVYIADLGQGELVEFVESVQPPIPREDKWVFIVSTLVGCPIGCLMCDAGGGFKRKLSVDEILAQIDYLVRGRYPDGRVPVKKFKIQFARIGEPALNMDVLDVLERLPDLYDAPGIMPSISTVAPKGTDTFFDRLLDIKNRLYSGGRFQLQFSVHTTDVCLRDRVIPVAKWDLPQIGEYGERFYVSGDRKITLNFALGWGWEVDEKLLLRYFNPDKFLIKITPINPTLKAKENGIVSYIDLDTLQERGDVIDRLKACGYDVILSIGELEENKIGSNCGQYVRRFLDKGEGVGDAYSYCKGL